MLTRSLDARELRLARDTKLERCAYFGLGDTFVEVRAGTENHEVELQVLQNCFALPSAFGWTAKGFDAT